MFATPQLWIICGAGSGVGKTRLAGALCRALPNAIYAKQGTSPWRAGKAMNYFRTDSALDAFLAGHQVLPRDQTRPNPAGGPRHLVVESNALAKRRSDAIILFLGPRVCHDGEGASDLPPRPDAECLRKRAQIRLDGTSRARDWKRVLQRVGLETTVLAPVLRALEGGVNGSGTGAVQEEQSRMRLKWVLGVLLFGGLWGAVEAGVGDALYAADVPFASVYLTVLAFFILGMASVVLPRFGSATAIGVCAMLYKFLNVPFFGCHLSAIALLGFSFDVVFRLRRPEGVPSTTRAALGGAAACYLGSLLFVLAMVFVFRSDFWIEKGLGGSWQHVVVAGSLSAIGCAITVPLGMRAAEGLSRARRFSLQSRWGTAVPVVLAVGLWAYGLVVKLFPV